MPLNAFSTMLADAAPAAGQTQPQPPNILLFIVPMLVLMYFMIFRPQQKRAKEQRQLLEKLKSGDRVITSAGLIGEVITVKERSVTLRSADAKFEVTKDSVVAITEPKAADSQS